ncbi:MAG: ATP/GTP-binding protein [Candidatus Methanodesulfokora washburnensis]|jgi:GTPase SAR1 family protein|uniref:GTPase n=1 Tax=Candidatus Methanodesulfokora washburnensis TaxID=2478471 RepID=A0A3R9PIG5_9CREN|nr:ATP/GTP-binding protein [Candidatus Methanodesulfokores washburnensis]RSN75096.1 hypothetical protein D6D85_07015 [Candidatus Methanodesulfokores washburnensis]
MEGLVVIGPAGSGKSTLIGALSRWMRKFSTIKIGKINMDPGADVLPYKPDFDIRSIVRAEEVMKNEKLGPNGAMVRSMEIVEERLDEVIDSILSLNADYYLIDTPGQMDAFVFRRSGRAIVEKISSKIRTAGIYLSDCERDVEDFVTAILMGKIAELRLNIRVIPVLNKIDLGGEDLRSLWERIMRGNLKAVEIGGGVGSEALMELIKSISLFSMPVEVIGISALRMEGLEHLFSKLNEVWCSCGDMT